MARTAVPRGSTVQSTSDLDGIAGAVHPKCAPGGIVAASKPRGDTTVACASTSSARVTRTTLGSASPAAVVPRCPMTDVQSPHRARIPRDREHDYTDEMAAQAAGLRRRADRRRPRARRQLLVRPRRPAGQHRELHRRRAGADRPRRPADRQRRARAGRLLRPAGDDRGHAGRQLQPRHAPAQRVRRRADDGRRRPHAAGAGVHLRRRAARRASSAAGSTSTSTGSGRRPRRPPARAS